MNDSDAALWADYAATRTTSARNALVVRYHDMATYHARQMFNKIPRGCGVDEADLRQDAQIGLLNAVETFEPSRGREFVTFASFRIRGAILDGLRGRDAVPRLARERSTKVEAMRHCQYAATGLLPTTEEIVAAMNLPPHLHRNMRDDSRPKSTHSLDEPIGDDEISIGDSVVGKGPEPGAEMEFDDLMQTLRIGFNARDLAVLEGYYLNGRSQRSISEDVGLTESGVGVIRRKLLPRFRRRLRKCLGIGEGM